MKQEMMGWQWHQLNHMQIIYTPFHTDNHTSTSSVKHITKVQQKLQFQQVLHSKILFHVMQCNICKAC